MIMTAAIFPHRANYVVAIDGFLISEWLLRAVGCFCTRKFVNTPGLVKHMQHVIKQGDVVVLFPEARYSLCGTQSELPVSVSKLIKLLKVPVVSLVMHGHHIDSPFWNPKSRSASHFTSELKLLYTAEDTETKTIADITQDLAETIRYDDFAWQRENRVAVRSRKRAEGLHRILYKCPHCGTEYRMDSLGIDIFCLCCGKHWSMDEYGVLHGSDGVTEYAHVPDWFEWERECVREEVIGASYFFESTVRVESLPNAKRFVKLGDGILTHSNDGFKLKLNYMDKEYNLEWKPHEMYACHIEFDYKKRGDCIDLNTPNDTLYIYPEGSDFAVTKIALATEEIYKSK